MKYLYTIGLYLILTLNSSGQDEFRAGLIVLPGNDTLSGFIDYKTSQINSSTCNFKKNSEAKVITFLPEDIVSYKFANEQWFLSKEVKINGESGKYFLECLFDGIADLFFFVDKSGNRHYFMEREEEFKRLYVEEKMVSMGNKTFKSTKQSFHVELRALIGNTPELTQKVSKVNLSHKSLLRFFTEYHNLVCPDSDCVKYSKQEIKVNDNKWNFNLGVSASAFTTGVRITKDINSPLGFVNIALSKEERIGRSTFLNQLHSYSVSPRLVFRMSKSNKAAFQLEALYRHTISSQNNITATVRNYSFPLLFSYTFRPYNNIRPFINIGINNTLESVNIRGYKKTLNFLDPEDSEKIISSEIDFLFPEKLKTLNTRINPMGGIGLHLGNLAHKYFSLELRHVYTYYSFHSTIFTQPTPSRVFSKIYISNWDLALSYTF